MINKFSLCIAIALIFTLPVNAAKLTTKSLYTMDEWEGSSPGVLHQVDENHLITVGDINGQSGIHRIDMKTNERIFLSFANLPRGYSDPPKFVSGNGITLVDIQGALYVTDGTKVGSSFIRNFGNTYIGGSTGFSRSNIRGLQYINSRFYFGLFRGDDTSQVSGLWISDATSSGTSEIVSDLEDLGEVFLANDGNTYFFASTAEDKEWGIWNYAEDTNEAEYVASISDGTGYIFDQTKSVRTQEGVFFCNSGRLFKFANDTTLSQIGSDCGSEDYPVTELVANNDSLYFLSSKGLWRSEGLPNDQVQISEVREGSHINGLCSTAGKVFFSTDGEKEDSSLFQIDNNGEPRLFDTQKNLFIIRCTSQGAVISQSPRTENTLGFLDFDSQRINYLSESSDYFIPSEFPIYEFSPVRIPRNKRSTFLITARDTPDKFGKVRILKTIPQMSPALPSILEVLE